MLFGKELFVRLRIGLAAALVVGLGLAGCKTAEQGPRQGVSILKVHPALAAEGKLEMAGLAQQRNLRGGQQLLISVPSVNPFMHEVQIQGQAFRYELVTPTVVLPKNTESQPLVGGKLKISKPRLDSPDKERGQQSFELTEAEELRQQVEAYENLLESLRQAYSATAWSEKAVAQWLNNSQFLLPSLTAGQMANLPRQLYRNSVALQTTANTRLTKAQTKLDKVVINPPGNKTDSAAVQAAQQEVAKFQQEMTILRTVEAHLKLTLNDTARANRLLLGQVYEQLRATEQNPQVVSKLIAVDGDEMDVTITLKPLSTYKVPPGTLAAPTLSYERTLQVTQRFRASVSAGPYLAGLINHSYSLLEDSVRQGRRPTPGRTDADTSTVPAFGRMKRIVRANSLDRLDIGVAALTHFHYRLTPAFDIAASAGLGLQTSGLRLMAGGTVLFGGKDQRLCLTYGLIAGPVTRLSGGYYEGQLVPTSTSVAPTQDNVNQTSWFGALTWNLTGSRK